MKQKIASKWSLSWTTEKKLNFSFLDSISNEKVPSSQLLDVEVFYYFYKKLNNDKNLPWKHSAVIITQSNTARKAFILTNLLKTTVW